MSTTYVILEVNPSTFDDIHQRLLAAEYQHCFGSDDAQPIIILGSVALKAETPKTVHISKLTAMNMTAGQEKKTPTVIHDGVVKNWVGFGWIDEGKATAEDKKKYPQVEE